MVHGTDAPLPSVALEIEGEVRRFSLLAVTGEPENPRLHPYKHSSCRRVSLFVIPGEKNCPVPYGCRPQPVFSCAGDREGGVGHEHAAHRRAIAMGHSLNGSRGDVEHGTKVARWRRDIRSHVRRQPGAASNEKRRNADDPDLRQRIHRAPWRAPPALEPWAEPTKKRPRFLRPYCPSWARPEGRRPDGEPKKGPEYFTLGIAPPGLEPGLS